MKVPFFSLSLANAGLSVFFYIFGRGPPYLFSQTIVFLLTMAI